MTKTKRILVPCLIAITAAACGARSASSTLPAQTRTEVLSHYLRGESLEQIAVDYRLHDRDDAREVVHDAMISLTKRYYRDR